MRAARVVGGVLSVAVILASCGGDGSPTVSPTRSASPTSHAASSPSTTPTTVPVATSTPVVDGGERSAQQLLADALDARLGPNGEVDQQLALDMFAAVYGGGDQLGAIPLPGDVEGSTALMLVHQVWDQLTSEQQQVIQAKLDLPVSTSETIEVASGQSVRALARRSAKFERVQEHEQTAASDAAVALVHAQVDAIRVFWGSPLAVPVQVDVMSADLPPPDANHSSPLADALSMTSDGTTAAWTLDDYSICRVRLFPAFMRQSVIDQIATAAHEIFHCYQSTVISLNDSVLLRAGQLWVIEGQAEWVGATIAGGGAAATAWWQVWLTRQQKLWRRDYDAMGFYASLARHGVNPWSVFRPMLSLPRSLAGADFATMYAAATPGLALDFLAQVAVDHASLTSIGDPWLPVGPGAAPALTAGPVEVPTNSAVTWAIHVDAYDFNRIVAKVADEVATITSDAGPWAVGGAGDALIVSGPGNQSGCVSGSCVCPDGLALAIPQLATNGRVAVGVTTADTRGRSVTISVSSIPLATACTTLPHRPAPSIPVPSDLGCIVGQWALSSLTPDDQFLPALEGIHYEGGVGGRYLDIAPNGAYVMTDDGSDPATGHGQVGGVPVDVVLTVTGRVEGAVERTSPSTVTFASTSASIDLHGVETVAGVRIPLDYHWDEAAYFGNGDATATCDGNSITLVFPNASFTYTRAE